MDAIRNEEGQRRTAKHGHRRTPDGRRRMDDAARTMQTKRGTTRDGHPRTLDGRRRTTDDGQLITYLQLTTYNLQLTTVRVTANGGGNILHSSWCANFKCQLPTIDRQFARWRLTLMFRMRCLRRQIRCILLRRTTAAAVPPATVAAPSGAAAPCPDSSYWRRASAGEEALVCRGGSSCDQ